MITHDLRLRDAREPLSAFLSQTEGLAEKRGPLLVQLPPSFAFEASLVAAFLDLLRTMFDGFVVCEPRHATWFSRQASSLLERYHVSRVAADPPCVTSAAEPGGWRGIAYFRLHGWPRMYWSRYEPGSIAALADRLSGLQSAGEVWCIFDNTGSGSAIDNARELSEQVHVRDGP